jgi:hypothetical protein
VPATMKVPIVERKHAFRHVHLVVATTVRINRLSEGRLRRKTAGRNATV